MKKVFTILFFSVLIFGVLSAQITITRNDMPNVGDSLIFTETIPFGIDYEATGENYIWDFSTLGGGSQSADYYTAVSSTPLLYQIVFNWPFWNPLASIASPNNDITFIPGIAFTDYYDFYKEQNASYTSVGFGITINSIPVPIEYDNPELLYSFPLTSNSEADSSESSFNINIPDLGYYETYRKRVNKVDGWGTLTTPLGTFQTLRIKSTLVTYDSIYIDSLQTGIPVSRTITEYKWLGNGFGRPILVVSKEGILPATAEYLAEELLPLSVDAGPDVTITEGEEIELNATVAGGSSPYGIIWSNGAIGNIATVSPDTTTTYSVNVVDASLQYASDEVTVFVNPGTYQQVIELLPGWNGLSLFISPQNISVAEILYPIQDQVIIMQNLEGIYYPVNNVNTLGDWNSSTGYCIKLNEGTNLQVEGIISAEKTLNLTEGWNLIPVLSSCEIETSVLASQIQSELKIIKEVAGTLVYWPEKSIFSLTKFFPAQAYWVKVTEDCVVVFPDCE